MRIVADENMPGLEIFSHLGEVTRQAGRRLKARDLAMADVLLVRSVTHVDQQLLAHTPVRFVGSATIGTDHVDRDWLAAQGIRFAHAPGCNAQAVVEYVLQAVLLWCEKVHRCPQDLSIGVIGVGNVGGRLAAHASTLGMRVVACDPPRERTGSMSAWEWASLAEALACDVVSLHVPLSHTGIDATFHLLDDKKLASLGDKQLLINSCRGSVVDNRALLARLVQPGAPTCVLDVWEDEPRIPRDLFTRVWLGTPHIAGYSQEGKLRGTWMLYEALGQWLGQTLKAPELPSFGEVTMDVKDWHAVLQLLRHFYRLEEDHQRLQLALNDEDAGQAFDALRKYYPARHEVSTSRLRGQLAEPYREVVSLLTGT